MATATQQPPVLASGDTPEPLRPPAGAQHSSIHVLPPDHPVLRLVRLLQHGVNSNVKCKLIRAIRASTTAHLKKTPTHRNLQLHAEALSELRFLALDELPADSVDPEALALYQEAIEYHSTRTQEAKPRVKKVKAEKTPKSPREPKAPREPRPRAGNDEVAQLMRGLDLDEMYALAQDRLGTPQTTLRARYGHLNPGLQRMNLGNRMRSKP